MNAESTTSVETDADATLTAAIERIKRLTTEADLGGGEAEKPRPVKPQAAPEPITDAFIPTEPTSFHAADLSDSEVETLVLKFLLARGDAAGREIAEQVKLPFRAGPRVAARHEERSSWSGTAGRPR